MGRSYRWKRIDVKKRKKYDTDDIEMKSDRLKEIETRKQKEIQRQTAKGGDM